MKILALTNMFPTPARPDLGSVVQEQVESVKGLGVDVDVLVIEGHRGKLEYMHAARQLASITRGRKHDLIHAHYGLSGAVGLTQRRLPVVTTFHGSDTGYVRWQGLVSRVVARHTTPIFVSRGGAERLGLDNATVIPCGVDLERFQPLSRTEARNRLGWDNDVPYALLAGSRKNPVKRADLFDAALAEARRTIPELRGTSLEGLPREQVRCVLSAVDVTLLTSDSEGSPVTVKESLACRTPVVSVPVGDLPELLNGLPGCAVVDRRPRLLAEAILAALSADRSESLRKRVLPLSTTRIAERIVLVYESILR